MAPTMRMSTNERRSNPRTVEVMKSTMSNTAGLTDRAQKLGEDGLLRRQPVLRLIKDDGGGSFDHLVRDLFTPMGRQAMHDDYLARRLGEELRRNPIGRENGRS